MKTTGRDYFCHGFMCTDHAVREGLCIYHLNLLAGGKSNKNRKKPCVRCGLEIAVRPDRSQSLCINCRTSLNSYEKKIWTA